MNKTSITDPLRIAEIVTPVSGLIGVTICPGKQQPHAFSGSWTRDLAMDLAKIVDWAKAGRLGQSILCTLMTTEELARFGVSNLGDAAREHGFDWFQLSIEDQGTPDQEFEIAWTYYGLRIRQALREGGRVLIHCLGGLGRSGTIAARLLVELGVVPDEAINIVRKARPGAIENNAQETHVRSIEAIHPRREVRYDRMFGCIIGGALGDALGYPIEFDDLASVRRKWGPDGLTVPAPDGGPFTTVSDDTQMTLFTLEGLLEAWGGSGLWPSYLEDRIVETIGAQYKHWLGTQGYDVESNTESWLVKRSSMRVPRAPGNTCISALRNSSAGTISNPLNDSKGCGAVMRTAPIGFLPLLVAAGRNEGSDKAGLVGILSRKDISSSGRLAARVGALTHGHPDGWGSAVMMTCIIGHITNGATLFQAVGLALQDLASIDPDGRVDTQPYRLVLERFKSDPEATPVSAFGRGWVGEEALAMAAFSALRATRFEDAISFAVNHDGDSDSTGSIAGQLWGTENGMRSMPHRWIERIDVFAEIVHLIGAIDLETAQNTSENEEPFPVFATIHHDRYTEEELHQINDVLAKQWLNRAPKRH